MIMLILVVGKAPQKSKTNNTVAQLLENNPDLIVGSSPDPQRRIKVAQRIAYVIGGMNVAIYWMAQLLWPQLLSYGSMIEGIVFLALGYCIGERQIWAAWTAVVLLGLDIILTILAFPHTIVAIGWLLVKAISVLFLFHGFTALRTTKGMITSDKLVASLVAVGAVVYGGFTASKTFNPPTSKVTPAVEQILQNTSTVATSGIASPSLSNPDISLLGSPYIDAKTDFAIQPPKGWTIDSSGNSGPNVQFADPTPHEVAVLTVAGGITNPGGQYTPQTFAAGAMQQFITTAADIGPNVTIVSQENTALDGRPAYLIDFTFSYVNKSNGKAYPMHATQLSTVGSDGLGYNIFMVSQEEIWPQYKNLLIMSASTFHFPRS